jgi:vitamin B12 transporter
MIRKPGDLPSPSLCLLARVSRGRWYSRVSDISTRRAAMVLARGTGDGEMRARFIHGLSWALASLSAAVGAGSALARDNPHKEEIIVTAARSPQPVSEVGASVTVIDAETLRRSQAVSAIDALRSTPGVGFNRNGGPGGVTSVRLRGAETDQTVVLIDGVKLNDPAAPGGGFDFANLLIADGAQIEILRGPQSSLYGSQAIGGVINILTPEGGEAITGGFDVEAGGLSSRRARARASGQAYGLRYAFSAGLFETEGVSAFSSARGGRERDSFFHQGASARIGFAVTPELSLEARAWMTNSRSDIDGFAAPSFTFGDTQERAKTDQAVLYAGAQLSSFDGILQQRFAIVQTRIERDLLDPQSSVPLTFSAVGVNDRLEYQAQLKLDSAIVLQWGLDRETAALETRAPSPFDPNPPAFNAKTRLDGAYGVVQVTPLPGLTATVSARYVDADRFGEKVTGQGSLIFTPDAGVTTLRINAGDGFKAPTLFQLFSDFGNPTLLAERATAWDIGLTRRAFDGALVGTIGYFERTTKNQIDFVTCAPGAAGICIGRPFGTYDNVGRSKADGLEASLVWTPNQDWRFGLSAWTLNARNTTPGSANFGRDLARRAGTSASFEAVRTLGEVGEVSLAVSHIGPSYDDPANAVRLKGYTLATVRAEWRMNPTAALYGRIENLTDEKYESAFQYGAMPRMAVIGVRAEF